jgi:hypothetical protein
MDALDFADTLTPEGDLYLVRHQRYKIYNILSHQFEEMPRLFFSLADLVNQAVPANMIPAMLASHLSDFGVTDMSQGVLVDNDAGVLNITINTEVQP